MKTIFGRNRRAIKDIQKQLDEVKNRMIRLAKLSNKPDFEYDTGVEVWCTRTKNYKYFNHTTRDTAKVIDRRYSPSRILNEYLVLINGNPYWEIEDSLSPFMCISNTGIAKESITETADIYKQVEKEEDIDKIVNYYAKEGAEDGLKAAIIKLIEQNSVVNEKND